LHGLELSITSLLNRASNKVVKVERVVDVVKVEKIVDVGDVVVGDDDRSLKFHSRVLGKLASSGKLLV
jgi:hypothetical protein